ncbi:unnamed protein product [Natator depressus]
MSISLVYSSGRQECGLVSWSSRNRAEKYQHDDGAFNWQWVVPAVSAELLQLSHRGLQSPYTVSEGQELLALNAYIRHLPTGQNS